VKSPALSVAIDKSKLTTHVGAAIRARPVAALTTAELEKWRNALVGATEDGSSSGEPSQRRNACAGPSSEGSSAVITSGARIVDQSRRLQIVLRFWSGRAPESVRRTERHRDSRRPLAG